MHSRALAPTDGRTPLDGSNKYVLHFPPGQLPPARRISMYDIEGFFFNNPIDRYGIGNMAEKPALDADGGLTIPIQRDPPGTSPDGPFFMGNATLPAGGADVPGRVHRAARGEGPIAGPRRRKMTMEAEPQARAPEHLPMSTKRHL